MSEQLHPKEIGIIGNGGQANEAESYLKSDETTVLFRALNKEYRDESDPSQIDIMNPVDYQKITPVVAAIGAPALRKKMVESWPGEKFVTIIADTSFIDRSTKVGEGSIIAPRAVITTDVEIGKHSIVNVASSISHNCRLGDYSTISPGAHIGGNVDIGDGAFIGIGVIISNNLKIASGVVVGAGAVVIEDLAQENGVYVGVPAKLVGQNESWLSEV